MLTLDALPNLPQCTALRTISEELWADPSVLALWLGGSLARGTGDAFSDIDLRIAREGSLDIPNTRLLVEATVHLSFPFGEEAVLHHLLLQDGTIWDVFIQTPQCPPSDEARLVLACRDELLAERLLGGSDPV